MFKWYRFTIDMSHPKNEKILKEVPKNDIVVLTTKQ